MGIKGLFNLIYPQCSETHIKNFRGSRIAIDAMPWLQKGMQAVKTCTINKFNKRLFFNQTFSMLAMLEKFNIHAILVIDGKAIKFKEGTTEDRKERTAENEKLMNYWLEKGNKDLAMKYARMSLRINRDHLAMLIEFLQEIKVEYWVAPNESDSQIAYMVRKNQVDYAITDDSDVVLFGADKIIFKLNDSGGCLLQQPNKFQVRYLKQNCIDYHYKKKDRLKNRVELRKKIGKGSHIDIKWITEMELQNYMSTQYKHLHFRSRKLIKDFEKLNILGRSNDVQVNDTTINMTGGNSGILLMNDTKDFLDFIEAEHEEITVFHQMTTNPNDNQDNNLNQNDDKGFMDIKNEYELVKKELIDTKIDSYVDQDDDEIENEGELNPSDQVDVEVNPSIYNNKLVKETIQVKDEIEVETKPVDKKKSLESLKNLTLTPRFEPIAILHQPEAKSLKAEKTPEAAMQAFQQQYLTMNMKLIIVAITGCDYIQSIKGIGIQTLVKIVFNIFFEYQSRSDSEQVKIKKEQSNVDVEFLIREIVNKLVELKQSITVEQYRMIQMVWIAFKQQKVWDPGVQAVQYASEVADRNQQQQILKVIGDINFDTEISLVVGYDYYMQYKFKRMNYLHYMYDKIKRLKKMNEMNKDKQRSNQEFLMFDNINMLKRKRMLGAKNTDSTDNDPNSTNHIMGNKDNLIDQTIIDRSEPLPKVVCSNPLMRSHLNQNISSKQLITNQENNPKAQKQDNEEFGHLDANQKKALAVINQVIEKEDNGIQDDPPVQEEDEYLNEEARDMFKLKNQKPNTKNTQSNSTKLVASSDNRIILFKNKKNSNKNKIDVKANNYKKITDQFTTKSK